MDANICHGKPTIRGLRYPVENILEWLSSGMSVDEILADYEDLEREDIMAALEIVQSGMLFMPDINMRKMLGNEKMSPKAPTVGAQPT